MKSYKFTFEDLDVWHKSLEFARAIINLTEEISVTRKHYRLLEQLESSAASIAVNIAEGKGRYSKKEFVQFLYIARGSLYETITFLRLFHRNNWIADQSISNLENQAEEISKMISGLIKSIRGSFNLAAKQPAAYEHNN